MIDTTNSVYDLLPKEDLEALRWMRGQGGLDVVRMHAELFQQLKEERNGYRDLAREYEKRLMPDGYEWPRYDTGEPVLITDVVVGQDYGEHLEVSSIEFHANGFTIHDRTGFSKWYESDAWFERPAIIAADGEPLEVGQTVWGIGRFQHKFEVLALNDIDPEIGSRFNVKCFNRNENKKCWCDPSLLTHQRPVVDADGVPIHEGDTVYLLPGGYCGDYPLYYYSGGDKMVVKELDPAHELEGVLKCAGDGKCDCFPLLHQLTHTKPEPPDTWERIEEDAKKSVCDYFDSDGRCSRCPQFLRRDCTESMHMDLVKRCKALADRGR